MKQGRAAFTLIELLVVIAILGILAGLLFPVFARVRENGRRTACQSNLKQIGMGLIQYSQDYDETLIPDWFSADTAPGDTYPKNGPIVGYKWPDAAYPYIKSEQVFTCPSATGVRAIPWKYYGNLTAQTTNFGSYSIMHGYGPGHGDENPPETPPVSHPQHVDANTGLISPEIVRLAQAASPTTTAWVMDGKDDDPAFYAQIVGTGDITPLVARHLDTINVLFLDGHVKAMRLDILNKRNASGVISSATVQDD